MRCVMTLDRRAQVFTVIVLLFVSPAQGWFEGGHHLIAVLAWDLLPPADQKSVIEILKQHPNFEEDFKAPADVLSVTQRNWWLIGRAGYWPDVARKYRDFNRPTWHYQLGATRTLGDVRPPKAPYALPSGATLNTKRLHVAQAVELARRTLRSRRSSAKEQALAICWLAHLLGDAHQPCHAGSLYVEGLFPDGDRGANLIPVGDDSNLHAYWDSQLGGRYNPERISAFAGRVRQASSWKSAQASLSSPGALLPETWLAESRDLGRRYVYTPFVIDAVEAARRAGREKVESLHLPQRYHMDASNLAIHRAALAAHRLAAIITSDLHPDRKADEPTL